MLSRTLRAPRAFRAPTQVFRAYASTKTTSNQIPANDPVERDVPPNVSETNAVPTSSEGSFDRVLQESVPEAEKMRTMQAPNVKGIWSRSQQHREVAMSGPRFEQTIMADQVSSLLKSQNIANSMPTSPDHMLLSSLFTSNQSAGPTSELYPVMAEVALLVTLRSSSM